MALHALASWNSGASSGSTSEPSDSSVFQSFFGKSIPKYYDEDFGGSSDEEEDKELKFMSLEEYQKELKKPEDGEALTSLAFLTTTGSGIGPSSTDLTSGSTTYLGQLELNVVDPPTPTCGDFEMETPQFRSGF